MADSLASRPFTLKNGVQLSNRLVKASTAEGLADKNFLPTEALIAAYRTWAEGGWGLILTGNVQVDARYLGQPTDVAYNEAVGYDDMLEGWKKWAAACNHDASRTVVQINHPGRQSPAGAGTRSFFTKNIAPSPIPLSLGKEFLPRLMSTLMFGTPREMTKQEIKETVGKFANTARLAAEAGFAGVELHAAHGYLLAQFLSAKSNQRSDEYGGSAAARAKIVGEVIQAVRAVVPREFIVGIKLNSVDHQSATALEDSLTQLKLITDAGIDFLEVSGGTYEDPQLYAGTNTSAKKVTVKDRTREAFFLEFARAIRKQVPGLPLVVTGGFRSRKVMEAALDDDALDLIGIARPAILNPSVPKNTILNTAVEEKDAKAYARLIEPHWLLKKIGNVVIGAGAETLWYAKQIAKMGDI
ncbi:NADH:flavin oxidoreductase/NADH oxidase [Dactylonectria macrodidyma]|uniref:NADH:flavin oxidoreductase/NADH oxidase n=1 Tax=Dactylonectria macrodidyma TaxID=307937 RepID=A0A9P9D1J2_9HYPO|nr:NADH:flavin oxidoreductase/NADH oxidase [Dactylonectria macrodidyma]